MSRVPILMYHQLMPRPDAAFSKYTVTPRAFAAQMRWLALAGYVPVSMTTLVEHRQRGEPWPRRAVVITFDDGFRDSMDFALPVLQRHGFTAMFYLVAGLIGGTSRWMSGTPGRFPLGDWAAVRKLRDAGMHCGAHSVSHPALAGSTAAEARTELVESRRMLEDALGTAVVHFAYPYGSVTPGVRALAAEAGYVSACTGEKHLADERDDLFLLPRVPVYGGDTLLDFICRLRTAERPRQLARRLLRARPRRA